MARRWVTIIACFLSLLGTENAVAQFTGNDLLDKCIYASRYVDGGEYTKPYSIGYCFGFMNSFVQTSMFTEVSMQPLDICFPFDEKFTTKQLIRIWVKYLKNHPEQLHEPAVLLAARAFKQAFPCNDESALD